MQIDAFNHIFPRPFVDALDAILPDKRLVQRMMTFQVLHDVEARLRLMDRFPGYQQVLAMSGPPLEFLAGAEHSPELARIANDGLAEICAKHPDRFPAFVAALPMNNQVASLAELDRAVTTLGARGVQIFSNINGRPLDDPAFLPLFERMAAFDLPILIHPERGPTHSDYASESRSKHEIWFTFGWPYETSAAMTRLVLAGLFDKLPALKIVAHHMGAMIPFFAGRVGPGMDELGCRSPDEDGAAVLKSLKRRPIDYFRMFYGDTAVNGARSAIRCGLDFFGVERCLFATDCPFDPEGGAMFIRETIAAIDDLGLAAADRERLFSGNAKALFRL